MLPVLDMLRTQDSSIFEGSFQGRLLLELVPVGAPWTVVTLDMAYATSLLDILAEH